MIKNNDHHESIPIGFDLIAEFRRDTSEKSPTNDLEFSMAQGVSTAQNAYPETDGGESETPRKSFSEQVTKSH